MTDRDSRIGKVDQEGGQEAVCELGVLCCTAKHKSDQAGDWRRRSRKEGTDGCLVERIMDKGKGLVSFRALVVRKRDDNGRDTAETKVRAWGIRLEMADGRWGMGDGGRRMEDGGWRGCR